MEVGGYFHIYFHLFFFLRSFPFHLCVVNFLLTLSRLCLGWWPKEPAGLKTLRLVSMPSWRRANIGHLIPSALLGSRGSSKVIRPEFREEGLTSLAFDMIATFTLLFSAISFGARYDFKL